MLCTQEIPLSHYQRNKPSRRHGFRVKWRTFNRCDRESKQAKEPAASQRASASQREQVSKRTRTQFDQESSFVSKHFIGKSATRTHGDEVCVRLLIFASMSENCCLLSVVGKVYTCIIKVPPYYMGAKSNDVSKTASVQACSSVCI
jgi:hypothetical protein